MSYLIVALQQHRVSKLECALEHSIPPWRLGHRQQDRHVGSEQRLEEHVRTTVTSRLPLHLPVALGRRPELRQRFHDLALNIFVRELRHKSLSIESIALGAAPANFPRASPPIWGRRSPPPDGATPVRPGQRNR